MTSIRRPCNPWPQRRDAVETCVRKIRYSSWDDAVAVALDIWRNNPRDQDSNPPEPYICSHCDLYHLGH